MKGLEFTRFRAPGVIALAAIVLLSALPAIGATTTKAASTHPGRDSGLNMVYDAKDGYVLMFGGSGIKNETWIFSRDTWTELHPSVAPHGRVDAGIAYDAADGYVVMFGGRAGSYVFNDTWEYVGGQWTNITVSAGPAPSTRWSPGMAYDAADGYVVLFGGHSDRPDRTFADTWEFVHGKWTNVTGTTGGTPPQRMGEGMAYDATDGYVLMYGGWTHGNDILNDTWKFSDGKWTPLSPGRNPGPKWWAGMTFDSTDGYVVLFAGIINCAKKWWTTPPDTWTYVGGVWTNVTHASDSPTQRFGEGFADDPAADNVLMFGGLNSTDVIAHDLSDTWTYQAEVWTNITKTA